MKLVYKISYLFIAHLIFINCENKKLISKNNNKKDLDISISNALKKSEKNINKIILLLVSNENKKIPTINTLLQSFDKYKNTFYAIKNTNFAVGDLSTTAKVTKIYVLNNGIILEEVSINLDKRNMNIVFEKLLTEIQMNYSNLSKKLQKKIDKIMNNNNNNCKISTPINKPKLGNSFIQIKDTSDEDSNKNIENRTSRAIWAAFLVFAICLALFLVVKYSIDWATASMNEINKMNEQKYKNLANFLTNKKFLKTSFDEDNSLNV